MSPESQLREEELSSWKEIAAYLGVTERTAQTWEKERALPVRRLPGGRGRVYAVRAELDRWKQPDGAIAAREPSAPAARRLMPLLLGAALLLLPLLALAVWWFLASRANPADVVVERQRVDVRDAGGNLLWQRHLPDVDERSHIRALVADMDGDGTNEIAVASAQSGEGADIEVFDRLGTRLWSFNTDQSVSVRGERLSPHYHPRALAVGRVRGRPVLMAALSHELYYPAQLVVLDGRGQVLSRYWHGGHIVSVAAGDADHDGAQEFYLSVVENTEGRAGVVVLDAERAGGAALDGRGRALFEAVEPAAERIRVLFPRSCVSHELSPMSVNFKTKIERDGFVADVQEAPAEPNPPSLLFHLNQDWTVRNVGLSNRFVLAHQRLRAQGRLDHDWSDREAAALHNVTILRPGN